MFTISAAAVVERRTSGLIRWVLVVPLMAATGSLVMSCDRSANNSVDGTSNGSSNGRWTTISLFAGALGWEGNIDGVGGEARFFAPYGLSADGVGNLYISESNSIRKVAVATGIVTTLAGGTNAGSVDGIGASAKFNLPLGLASDLAGNLYVADGQNATIRKVEVTTGVVTTIAGTQGMTGSADGIGGEARFVFPRGVATDGAGNLFVSDGPTIRKVELSTGIVSTVAGAAGMAEISDGTGTEARFRSPAGLTFDGAGNLYVCDYDIIRKVVLATAVVSSLSPYVYCSGLASDGTGSLYTSFQKQIQKVTADGIATTIAGATNGFGSSDGPGDTAHFDWPALLAADGRGSLYVGDGGDAGYATIRTVALATGSVTTLAGAAPMTGSADGLGGWARFNHPWGVVAEGKAVYVADLGNGTIRKIDMATAEVSTLAGTPGVQGFADGVGATARFDFPTAMATDGAGHLFVADLRTIRTIDLASREVITIAGTANENGGEDGIGPAASFDYPSGVAPDSAGNLYVADNFTIRKVALATAEVTTISGVAGKSGGTDGIGHAARFNQLKGVAVDDSGNLYVADSQNRTIRKVVLATGAVTTLAGAAGMRGSVDGTGAAARFLYPTQLIIDKSGKLLVADDETVREVNPNTGAVVTVVGRGGQQGVRLGPLPGSLNAVRGLALVSNSQLVLVDSNENSVLLIH